MSLGRILCVTSNLPRWQGDSTTPFVLHLAQDLQRLGWQVDMLAPHALDALPRESLGGVSIDRFRYLWPVSAQTVCYQGGALINLRKNPFNKLKLPALVAAELGAVARRLATGRYDLLHSHWILPQGFTGMVARLVRPVPHVVTVHGGDIFALRGRLMESLKRISLKRADAVTVNSSFTETSVAELAPSQAALHRIPMGVTLQRDGDRPDAARVEQLRRRYRRQGGPLLVFVGRLVDEKGVEDLLRAVAALRGPLPGVSALVVGEGQDRDALEGLAVELGIAERVAFVGWVDPAEVCAYLAAGDAFVGPSRRAANGWVEAQGLTFLEAMVAGTPVVATALGGIIDSVIDGRTGLLVPERAPDAIAAAVERIHADPAFAAALTARADRHVRAHFSREASAGSFSELFRSLLSGPRP